MKIKKYYGESVIGNCLDCGMDFQDYTKRKEAYNHAKKTGHRVRVEISSTFHYNH